MAAAAVASLSGLGAWGLQFLAVWMLGLVLGWLVSNTACRLRRQAAVRRNSMKCSRLGAAPPRPAVELVAFICDLAAAAEASLGGAKPARQGAVPVDASRPLGKAHRPVSPPFPHHQVRQAAAQLLERQP